MPKSPEHDPPSVAAQALAAVPFLAPLSPVDLAKLAGVLEDQWFDAGSEVFESGGRGDALFILREGTAERRVAGSRIGLIHPPEVFGELALLTDQPRSSSVVAVTPIRVWVLPQHRVHSLLRAEPELLFDLSRAIGRELAKARRALGELQSELDRWVAFLLDSLSPSRRALVEAAALFDDAPPIEVLFRLAGAPDLSDIGVIAELESVASVLQVTKGRRSIPPAMREAIRRGLETAGRREQTQARVRDVAQALEREGQRDAALTAYRAAGAQEDAARIEPTPASSTSVELPSAAARGNGKTNLVRVAGLLLAIVPLLFWNAAPPSGLSIEGWRALLTLVCAAILFATEALPEAVIALALLAVWVVGRVVPARAALDGFATQAWVLVLAVLAVGVAVGNSGLLYRLALLALGRKQRSFASRCITLALVGAAVTPALPNATSRAALAAPMVREVADALGYAAGSRAACGLALASLIGFGQMAGLFLTGSSVGILLYGMLPTQTRAQFDFAGWVVAALPLHVVLLAGSLALTVRMYRPAAGDGPSVDRLALQRAVLGDMRRDEKVCLAVMVLMIAGFLSEPWHGIHGAWVGVIALAALALGRALDATMLRTGVNWPFLVFFGVITSLATVFQSLGVDAWLTRAVSGPMGSAASDSFLFCMLLTLVGFALSLVIRWQAAAPLLTLLALPLAEVAKVNPFLVALISLVSTQVWFLPYQSTVYLAFYHGTGELFSHRTARALAIAWGPLVLVSVAAAWPAWRAMGLVH